MARTVVRRDRLAAGLAAGGVSGLTLAAFAAFAQSRAGEPVSGTYVYLAVALASRQAAGTAWAVPVGIVVLFACTTLWAIGYLTAAEKQPQLLTRPVISGVGFGVIVWFVMQLMLIPIGQFRQPDVGTFSRDFIAFTAFFGVPLALVAARLTRAP